MLRCDYSFLFTVILVHIDRPLHIAAKSGLVKVVKELVNRGADLNARDADGMCHTAVMLLVLCWVYAPCHPQGIMFAPQNNMQR